MRGDPRKTLLRTRTYTCAARRRGPTDAPRGPQDAIPPYIPPAKQALLSDVVALYSNEVAFVALTSTGTVVTWGDDDAGGDSSGVDSELVNVQSIESSGSAFTAMCRAA